MKPILSRTSVIRATILALTLVLWAANPPSERLSAAGFDGPPPRSLRDAFARHCGECHGDAKQESGLQLDTLSDSQWRDYDLLAQVTKRLEDGDMPPADAQVPLPDDQRRPITAALNSRLAALGDMRLAGTLSRLTRTQWCDTLEDLTGVEVKRPYELPIDSTRAMPRLGEHQLLTPLAMRQYQAVANRYVEEVILDGLPEVMTYRVDYAKPENQIGNTSNEAQPYGIQSHNDMTNLVIRSPVTGFALEGVYEFEFDYYHARRDDPKKGGRPAPVQVGKNSHFGRFRSGGEILSRPYTHNLDGEKLHPSGRVEFYRFDQPLRVRLSKDHKTVVFFVHGGGPVPWVFRGVTVRGPLDKTYPASHEKIFGAARRDADLATCRRVLDSLATRLFRRRVDAEIMAPYYEMAAAEYDTGGNLFSATKPCLKAMICSPYFLFKDLGNQPDLEGRMIATRLSYFLWNTAPDARLMTLAARGELTDPAVRRGEAERLLADPDKSERFVRLFVAQWLGLDKFGDFAPNAAYLDANQLARLRPSVEQEPYAFFRVLLDENLSARNAIDSDFVVWDRALADYYGGKDQGVNKHDLDGEGFQKLSLSRAPDPAQRRLGGLVSMPIIMSMTTDGETTHPILRGAWVIKHLFGKTLEPPDSVPALEIDLSNVDKPKDILRLHKQERSCYACHVKMDYLGLALENYDVMGRWQSHYLFPVIEGKRFKLVTKDPVDALAESPDGGPIDGVTGLKRHLLEREDEILRNLAERLFSYALGREVRYRDRPAIDRLLQTARANDYRLRDLILEIAVSDSFIHR